MRALALPLRQVRGAGTGIRRHRLFFLGFKLREKEAPERRRWLAGWRRRRRAAQDGGGTAKGSASARQLLAVGQQQGAVQLAAAGDDPVPSVAVQSKDSWIEGYYGSLSEGPEQLRSPQLPPREAPVAVPSPLPRKPTSVRLSVAPEPCAGSVSSACSTDGYGTAGEVPEGSDVAAERARVEALWQQW